MSNRRQQLDGRLAALADRYGLPTASMAMLELLVELLVTDPHAPTSIRDRADVIDRHVADSLVALELDAVRMADRSLDLGSGAGLPGLPLAIALPTTAFVLLESARRKFEFLERTAAALGLSNVRVAHARAEEYRPGLGQHDLVTARAVAALEVTAEYAAPLLRVGGVLVAWGGRRSNDAEAAATRAAAQLGLGELRVLRVQPFPGAEHHHLNLMSKVVETPPRFPRRAGTARKRPLGGPPASTRSSDRAAR